MALIEQTMKHFNSPPKQKEKEKENGDWVLTVCKEDIVTGLCPNTVS